MKKISKLAMMTSLAMGATFLPAHAALDSTYAANDVMLGFRAATSTGATTTLMFNLGSAATYRDATSNILNIGTIGSLLNTTYGVGGGDASQWYERTNLWAGFISATNGVNIDDSGGVPIASQTTDYNSTIYVSTRRTATGTVGAANSTTPGNSIALDAQVGGGYITALGGTFDTYDSGGIYNQAASTTNGWNSYVTGSNSVDFSTFNIEAAFTAGNRGSFGAAGTVEQIWDFYRVANFPNTDVNYGKGIYQGSFTLNSAGDVSYIAAVPEPSTTMLMGLGFAGVFFVMRRRFNRAALA